MKQQYSEIKIKDSPLHWTKEEIEALTNGVKKYGQGSWGEILMEGKGIFKPHRGWKSLSDQWKNNSSANAPVIDIEEIQPPPPTIKEPFTEEEVRALKNGVKEFGTEDWQGLLNLTRASFQKTRTCEDLKLKWNELNQKAKPSHRPNPDELSNIQVIQQAKNGKYYYLKLSYEEIAALKVGIVRFGGSNFKKIHSYYKSTFAPNITPDVLREAYHIMTHRQPTNSHGEENRHVWTSEETLKLLSVINDQGKVDWKKVPYDRTLFQLPDHSIYGRWCWLVKKYKTKDPKEIRRRFEEDPPTFRY